jgi:hypothetical protein
VEDEPAAGGGGVEVLVRRDQLVLNLTDKWCPFSPT